jgi:uncharacterized protein YecT (DUF1311 family)
MANMKLEYSKPQPAMLEFVCMRRRLSATVCIIGGFILPAAFGQNTAEAFAEAARHYKLADAELSKEYERALKSIAQYYRPSDVANLRDAQRKWIAYRDAVCKAEYELIGGGTAGPTTRMACLVRLTKQRTADLEADY